VLFAVSIAIPTHFPITIEGTVYKGYSDIALAVVPWATIFEYNAGRFVAELLILVVIGAQFYCGMSSVTANSRMIFAFSRDGAVPFSNYWHHVSKRSRVPVRTAWFGAVGAFILAVPYLWNVVAYGAVTSIAVIGLYIAYLIPVFLRRINGKSFVPGPWVLSKTWGPLIGWVAIVWVVFICIILCLPQFTWKGAASFNAWFNYTPVVLAVVIGFAGVWYAVSARKWFKGPKVQGSAEELAAIERELSI
jgi:amino acid transporter